MKTSTEGLLCHALHATSLATTATQSSYQDMSIPDMHSAYTTLRIRNADTAGRGF